MKTDSFAPQLVLGFFVGLFAGILATAGIYWGMFTGGIPAVAIALWERSLSLVPMRLFSLLIVSLKFAAKPLAFWGMLAGLVGSFALIGMIAVRPLSRRPVVTASLLWLVTSGLLALLTLQPAVTHLGARLSAQGVDLAPIVLQTRVTLAILGYGFFFAASFAILFSILRRRMSGMRSQGSRFADLTNATRNPGSDQMTRRALFFRAVVLLVASAAALLLKQIQAAAQSAQVAASNLFERIRGLPPEITPNDKFYIISKNPPGLDPAVDVRRWSLEIAGLVAWTTRLTYDELRTMPSVEQVQTLECISNEVGGDLISNAKWRGVRLRDVLMRVGGDPPKRREGSLLLCRRLQNGHPPRGCHEPYHPAGFEMNGELLPKEHGFPVRLLVPGLYGMKNPKWIIKIEVVDYDFKGFWEAQGWSDEAVVKTMSKFTTPDRRVYPVGKIELGGVACAGDRTIAAVEYSTDHGKTWQKAKFKPPLGKFTWALWGAIWKAAGPGEYVLKVRAKDGSGVLQTEREKPPLPEGATGYHTLHIRVR